MKTQALLLGEEAKAARAAAARGALIGRAAEIVAQKLAAGGRLVYVGAGTSGRLGTLDAVECVPTFGIPPSRVVPVIAGGPGALTRSVEGAEDSVREAEQRLRRVAVGPTDAVCCIAASGVTPFVLASLEYARFRRAATIFVTCGREPGDHGPEGRPLADVVIALDTGARGDRRLDATPRAGTATKMVLNAISTTAFVLLGKTYAGLMVDVRPTNAKLWARAVRIVRALTGLPEPAARKLIEKAGGRAKVALVMHHARVPGGARACRSRSSRTRDRCAPSWAMSPSCPCRLSPWAKAGDRGRPGRSARAAHRPARQARAPGHRPPVGNERRWH